MFLNLLHKHTSIGNSYSSFFLFFRVRKPQMLFVPAENRLHFAVVSFDFKARNGTVPRLAGSLRKNEFEYF